MALANMNGGLHISDTAIFCVVSLLLLIIVNFFLSIWNVWLKSRGMRIFNLIAWLPLMALGILAVKLGGAWFLIFPLLQLSLIWSTKPLSRYTSDEETTEV